METVPEPPGFTGTRAPKPRDLRGMPPVREGIRPISHHYVPKWLLKRFCDEKGKLWWRRCDWPPEKVHPQSLTSVFYQNHLNTLYTADGGKDPRVETALAKLDGELSDITDSLVKQGRRGNPPELDEESRTQALFVHLRAIQAGPRTCTVKRSGHTMPA